MNQDSRIILPGQPAMNNTNRLLQENMYMKQALINLQRSHDGLFMFLVLLLKREKEKEIELSKKEAEHPVNTKEWFVHTKKLKKGRLLLKLEHITDPTGVTDDSMAKAGSERDSDGSGSKGAGQDS